MRQMTTNQTDRSGTGSRIGKWALIAVAIPVASRVMRRVGRQIQERRGNAQVAHMMHRAASAADTYGRRGRW